MKISKSQGRKGPSWGAEKRWTAEVAEGQWSPGVRWPRSALSLSRGTQVSGLPEASHPNGHAQLSRLHLPWFQLTSWSHVDEWSPGVSQGVEITFSEPELV